ncbi:MAG: AMP-binding protein [Candidatus Puniceispirillales bacterium]
MEKIWLKSYPKGVPAEINLDEFTSLVDLFDKTCERFDEKTAFTNFGVKINFKQLKSYSENLSSYFLNELKLNKGDRVAIMMPNVLQYPITTFGILKSGLVVDNINPLFTPRELKAQLNDSGSETIVIAENFAANLQEIIRETSVKNVIITSLGEFLGLKGILINFVIRNIRKMVPKYSLPNSQNFKEALKIGSNFSFKKQDIDKEDIAFLQYTGGTTGGVKAAILSHRNILANAIQVREWLGNKLKFGEDLAICALPLYHIFALTCNSIVFFYFGANNILITNPRDIPGFVKELKKYKFTFISGVNTLFNKLLENPDFKDCDFSELNISIAGGMPVQKSVGDRWQKTTGCLMVVGYGLSETAPAASIDPIDGKSFSDAIGLPLPSTEMSIQNDGGQILPVGDEGEICIRGPQVMRGYWNNDEDTKKVLTKDGWFKTGDIGIMREDGFFKIVDRKKDMIIVSGFNVYPSDIEEVAMKHEKVFEAGCIGVKGENEQEIVKLFVSLNEGVTLTKEEMTKYCRENLTAYKVPKLLEIVDEIPKSNVGKILRRELREK